MKNVLSLVLLSLISLLSAGAQDTIPVKSGWNLIGAVGSGTIHDVLRTVPDSLTVSSFFGYRPGTGYLSTDTLGMGSGFWVKMKADGIVIFNTTTPEDTCRSRAFVYAGRFYHTVNIGGRCWMAENLDVGVMIDSTENPADNGTIEKYCYRNDPANCALYGGLYQWNEAMQYANTEGSQGICPAGWHIPTYAELQILSSLPGAGGNALKAVGQGAGGGAGTNTTGFSALLGGNRDRFTHFNGLNSLFVLWSSLEWAGGAARFLYLNPSSGSVDIDYDYKSYGFSVRCILFDGLMTE